MTWLLTSCLHTNHWESNRIHTVCGFLELSQKCVCEWETEFVHNDGSLVVSLSADDAQHDSLAEAFGQFGHLKTIHDNSLPVLVILTPDPTGPVRIMNHTQLRARPENLKVSARGEKQFVSVDFVDDPLQMQQCWHSQHTSRGYPTMLCSTGRLLGYSLVCIQLERWKSSTCVSVFSCVTVLLSIEKMTAPNIDVH